MQQFSPFVLEPPDDQTVEEWLLQYDNRPKLAPRWPDSERMTLVAVVLDKVDSSTAAAFILTHPSQADSVLRALMSDSRLLALFFAVARMRVLPFCPGLTLDSWTQEGTD